MASAVLHQLDMGLGRRRVTLEFTDEWLAEALEACDPIDRAVIAEADGPDGTVADKLLALQTLVFRWEQRHKNDVPGEGDQPDEGQEPSPGTSHNPAPADAT